MIPILKYPDKGLRDRYSHGQIENPMLPQRPSHGPPVSQSYLVRSISYYHGYPTGISAFQATYPPADDLGIGIGLGRHSVDKVYNNEPKAREMDVLNTISTIRVHQNETGSRESCKKAGGSEKRRSSMVAGNNVQHMTSEGRDESRSRSASDVDAEEETQDLHRNSSRSVNKNGGSASMTASTTAGEDHVVDGQEGDAGNWQTFQELLLRVQTESGSADRGRADPCIPPARTNGDTQGPRIAGNLIESRGGGYCRAKNDGSWISGSKQGSSNLSLNPISQDDYQNASDKSFIVSSTSGLHDELANGKRSVWDVTSDFQSAQKSADRSSRTKNWDNYEPHDLSMVCGVEKGASRGFDPAVELDSQIPAQNGIKKEPKSRGDISKRPRDGLKGSGKEKMLSSAKHGSEKRMMDPVTTRGKSSKLNTLADAKARAEKLRAFKADLQKAKKEKVQLAPFSFIFSTKGLVYLLTERSKINSLAIISTL